VPQSLDEALAALTPCLVKNCGRLKAQELRYLAKLYILTLCCGEHRLQKTQPLNSFVLPRRMACVLRCKSCTLSLKRIEDSKPEPMAPELVQYVLELRDLRLGYIWLQNLRFF